MRYDADRRWDPGPTNTPYPGMPEAALAAVNDALRLSLKGIAAHLAALD
jgi:hypothetical protein